MTATATAPTPRPRRPATSVTSAPIFGIDRGPISGVAPGAWVMAYKVCGLEGCFGSDSAAAVAAGDPRRRRRHQLLDLRRRRPVHRPRRAGLPRRLRRRHHRRRLGRQLRPRRRHDRPPRRRGSSRSPPPPRRATFQSTLTLADGAATRRRSPAPRSPTGVATPTPVVLAQNIAGYDDALLRRRRSGRCGGRQDRRLPARRRIGRVAEGLSTSLPGGAVGMILYNPPLADTETDNHFLPTVHLADGTEFLAFMAAHPDATATFTDGARPTAQGDVMAAFSSRGPGGQFLKPDITAPGVQILAGNTPTPDEVAGGPAGRVLPGHRRHLDVVAAHRRVGDPAQGAAPGLDAGRDQVGADDHGRRPTSSRRTLTTPADPFDVGAGRVDLTKAGDAPIVFDETGAEHVRPSATTRSRRSTSTCRRSTCRRCRAAITVTRTATNVTNKAVQLHVVDVTSPAGSKIKVSPSSGKIKPGQTQTFEITITSNAPDGPVLRSDQLLLDHRHPAGAPAGGVLQPAGRCDAHPEVHTRPASAEARRRRAR